MLQRLRENVDTILLLTAFVGGVWFIDNLDQRVADMQALDERWFEVDGEQTDQVVALIEEVRTDQGRILGLLQGTGGAQFVYDLGYQAGAASCRP